jgi:hypothetical protein
MVEAVGMLNTRLEQEYRVRLAVRLGIHTGLVVVGEVGSGGRQEQLALGEGRPLSWAPSAHAVAGGRRTSRRGSRAWRLQIRSSSARRPPTSSTAILSVSRLGRRRSKACPSRSRCIGSCTRVGRRPGSTSLR